MVLFVQKAPKGGGGNISKMKGLVIVFFFKDALDFCALHMERP